MSPLTEQFEETTKRLDHLYQQINDESTTSGWDKSVVSQIQNNIVTARDSIKNGLEVMRKSGVS